MHFIIKFFLTFSTKENMKMLCLTWCNSMIAKLNIFKTTSTCIISFKIKTNTTVSFFIIQNFVSNIFVCVLMMFTVDYKINGVVFNVDSINIFQRINLVCHVCNIIIVKSTYHMNNRVYLTDIFQELVS